MSLGVRNGAMLKYVVPARRCDVRVRIPQSTIKQNRGNWGFVIHHKRLFAAISWPAMATAKLLRRGFVCYADPNITILHRNNTNHK